MIITIEGEPKEVADLALELQNRLSPDELSSCFDSIQNRLETMLKNKITEELSTTNRDNA